MSEQFVTVQVGSIFHNFRQRVESLRDEVLTDGSKILKREEEASIRLRWFDKGITLRSLKEEVVTEGDSKIYRLFPTATSKRGFPYPTAGEYGTGREGARTGQPAPVGWEYGDSKGMAARRYSRIAVGIAKPLIVSNAKQLIENFTVS